MSKQLVVNNFRGIVRIPVKILNGDLSNNRLKVKSLPLAIFQKLFILDDCSGPAYTFGFKRQTILKVKQRLNFSK